MNKSSQLGTAAVLLVCAFAAGALLYKHFGPGGGQPAGSAAEEIEPAPATLIAGAPVPGNLPDFSLPDLNGKVHSIRQWAGQPLIINFWATWCAPCREEIPLLQKLRREKVANRLEIVGIAVDFAADVRKYIAQTSIEYPILIGEDDGPEVASAFGVHELMLPFSVFVDGRGRILALRMGQLHEDQAAVIVSALLDLNSGTLDLEAAKARVAAALRQ